MAETDEIEDIKHTIKTSDVIAMADHQQTSLKYLYYMYNFIPQYCMLLSPDYIFKQ